MGGRKARSRPEAGSRRAGWLLTVLQWYDAEEAPEDRQDVLKKMEDRLVATFKAKLRVF
jgi:hypothetical protein